MPLQAVFGLSVALGFVSWTLVAVFYLWPALRRLPQAAALRPILLLHSTRFAGLAFIVPGVVSPDIPAGFAEPAAYGDLIAALLALASLRIRIRTGRSPVRIGPRAENFTTWRARPDATGARIVPRGAGGGVG